ncbi:MAG: response regulator, partial [Acidobacteriota bacterium]
MSRVRLPERFSLLLVEDDEVDRMAFERYVRREKKPYDYVAVSSVSEARVAIEEGDFDVILSDFHLGDGTGADVLALDTGAPVVVITGAGDEATAIQAMRGGAFDYLIKDAERSYLPMLPVTVEAAWRRWSAERRAHMLSQALTSINDSIYITDRDGRLIFVNDTFRAAYGYDDDDVLGQATDMLWADLSRAGQLLPTKPGELPPGGERGECLQQRRDGSVFPGL